jgi:hypothetical protein
MSSETQENIIGWEFGENMVYLEQRFVFIQGGCLHGEWKLRQKASAISA